MQKAGHVTFANNPEDKMPMIAHDVVRKYSHGVFGFGPGDKLQEILVIARSLEENALVVSAIDAMND
jgi:hypothetical protein